VATTRRAMGTIESAKADPELLTSLLSSRSESEAAVAFTLLRYSLSESDLMRLANLREIVRLLPTAAFRSGEGLEMLERAGGYEYTGRSYRRAFESAQGVFGVEFIGGGHDCRGVVVHTPRGRQALVGDERCIVKPKLLTLIVDHRILLDAIIEALELLGSPLAPPIYVSAEDFLAEHRVATMRDTFGGLF